MINTDQTKAEIQQEVRDLRDEVPQLQSVDLYQNKEELISAVEDALHAHYEDTQGSIPEDDVVEAQPSADPQPEPDTAAAEVKPYNRSEHTGLRI